MTYLQCFQSVDEAKAKIFSLMLSTFGRFKKEIAVSSCQKTRDFEHRKQDLIRRQRVERQSLKTRQQEHWTEECKARQVRFRTGLKGLWDGLRGHNGRIRYRNELEALEAVRRDRGERDALIHKHLEQRQHIYLFKLEPREEFALERAHLERDTQSYENMRDEYSRDGPNMF